MKKEYSNPNFRLLHVGEDIVTASAISTHEKKGNGQQLAPSSVAPQFEN